MEVVSAVELSSSEKELLVNKIKKGKINKVNIKNIIDKTIIGGTIVKHQDLVLDNSINNNINKLEKSLIE